MVYEFIYKMKNVCKNMDDAMICNLLEKLSEDQFKIVEHVYCNVNMPKKTDFLDYCKRGIDMHNTMYKSFFDIITLAQAGNFSRDEIMNAIANYVYRVVLYGGAFEARKAMSILFRNVRLVGVTFAHILEAKRLRRLAKKN